jgi:hypothetical protein
MFFRYVGSYIFQKIATFITTAVRTSNPIIFVFVRIHVNMYIRIYVYIRIYNYMKI